MNISAPLSYSMDIWSAMFRITYILFAILFLGLVSCNGSYRNFNKQKYTRLKSLKHSLVETEDEEIEESQTINQNFNYSDEAITDSEEDNPEIEYTTNVVEISEPQIVFKDTTKTNRRSLKERWLEGKFQYTGDLDNKDYRASRRFFRAALFWLIPLVIAGLLLAMFFVSAAGGTAIISGALGAIIMLFSFNLGATSFFVGMMYLLASATAMRRFHNHMSEQGKELPKKPKNQRVLVVLGLMLFGSVPFLIPFFIMWAWYRARAKTTPSMY